MENECAKRTLGGNKVLCVKLGLLEKSVCKKGYWGKNRVFAENRCDEGTLSKIGHFGGENGALGENKCVKGTLM